MDNGVHFHWIDPFGLENLTEGYLIYISRFHRFETVSVLGFGNLQSEAWANLISCFLPRIGTRALGTHVGFLCGAFTTRGAKFESATDNNKNDEPNRGPVTPSSLALTLSFGA